MTALRGDTGGLRGYAKVLRDISERKRATRAMAEGRSRLATVVGSAMDAIITRDADHNVVLLNAAAEVMFGCPAAEALWRKPEQFIPQRFRKAHVRHVRGFARTGVTSRAMQQPGTLNGIRRDGEEFPIEASSGPIDVRWTLEPKHVTVMIHWRESGGPAICPPSRRGFGSRLLECAITHELGGNAEIHFAPAGAECRIWFPLSSRITVPP